MIKIIGHRGASGYAPENTIASFQKAIDLGCDRVELDIRLTKDAIAVAIHDETIDKTTNGSGKVGDFTLESIQKFDSGQGEMIPTLREVIELCKGKIELQIELKKGGTPSKVHELLVEYNLAENVVISSFNKELLKEVKLLNNNYQTLLLFKDYSNELWDIAEDLKLGYIGPKAEIVTKDLIDKAHAKGLKVYAYHTNDIDLGNKLISLGIDEIGTKFPDRYLLK